MYPSAFDPYHRYDYFEGYENEGGDLQDYPFEDDGRSDECDHLPNNHINPFIPGSFALRRIESHEEDSDEDSGSEADAYAQSQAHLAATRSGRRVGTSGVVGVPQRVGGRPPRTPIYEEEEIDENEDQALLGAERV